MIDAIRLGLMTPLTGLVELYGSEISRAARIACDEINARGGLFGRPLELIVEDDGSVPATAVPAAQRLIDEHGCVAIIGNLLSNSRIAIATRVAQPRRIPYLNFSFYEGSIASRYFFHFAALPNQQIDKMIPYMAHRFGLKMFFAGNNYEWPRGSIDAAKRALLRCGGNVVGEEYLSIGCSAKEIDSLLDQVARSGVDVFVPYFAGSDQITLLNRFYGRGLKQHMAVVMGHYDEAMVANLAPEVREGLYSSNTYFMSIETDRNRELLRRLARQPGVNGIWPDGNGIVTNFGEGTYVCVHAFAHAVEQAGDTEAEALVDALEQVRVIAPQGVVEMDAATHHAAVHGYLARCNYDGSFTLVESFGRERPVIPERYRAAIPAEKKPETRPDTETTARIAAKLASSDGDPGMAHQILAIADMAVIASREDGLITEANRSACQIFGYSTEELIGLSIHLLVPPHLREVHQTHFESFVAGEETERTMSRRNEVLGYRKDGTFFPLEASIAKFQSAKGLLLVVTMRDITDRKKAEQKLLRRATHDPLTGLPNRALIRDRLTTALQHSRRSGHSVALLFIDLDGFKLINDTKGHEAGDSVLKTISTRLINQIRPGDTVARLAGDEFVVLCEQVEQPTAMSVMAERINDVCRQPIRFQQQPLYVTASIGIALGSGATHSTDDLLRFADTAMYEVKQQGRDGWTFFNEGLQEQARQRLRITTGLRQAIERDELSVRFQPIVRAHHEQVVGAELLLRWHAEDGDIAPASFIPVAEVTGAIVPIGLWVFRKACEAEVAWRQRWGSAAPYVSVNVSARQLSERKLVSEFAAILQETGADTRRILLEITETSLMADVESNLRILRQLADLGLKTAVDDFGTGYSSLAQLLRLPVSVLKIDRAFVDGIDKSKESRAIVLAVIGLARALGLKIIAEGVENASQQIELQGYGCEVMQGYHFYRPKESAEFIELIDRIEQCSSNVTAPEELYFILYVSRATSPFTPEELNELWHLAAERNLALRISGYLIHQHGYFMQFIEGRRQDIDALIERIQDDPRHDDMHVVIKGNSRQRIFRDWGMGFDNNDSSEAFIDFTPWRKREITLRNLADDPQMALAYIAAHAHENRLLPTEKRAHR